MAPYHIIKLNQPCLGSSCHEVLGASSEKDLLSDFSPFGNRVHLIRFVWWQKREIFLLTVASSPRTVIVHQD
ncbi:hypothetical protein AAMO2058_001199700 [Amorphochlora amoebiformis]